MKTIAGVRLGLLALAAFLAAACGSPAAIATASGSRTTPTVTANPIASPTPLPQANQCQAPSNRCLALVTLRGSNKLVVRDITDIAHSKTVGTLGAYPNIARYGSSLEGAAGQFASSTELSYLGGPTDDNYGVPTSLFRAPFSGLPKTTVVKGSQGIFVFAWNPSGTSVVYLTSTFEGTTAHLLTAGHDRVLGSLPAIGVGGCEQGPCPGPFQNPADNWDFRLSYSADGGFVSVVQAGIRGFFRIWTADGQLLSSSDSGGMNMSVWSGGALYFRDAQGVRVWRTGATSTFLPRVSWIRPKAAPTGGTIVYEARDSHRYGHVFIVDTASGKVRDLGRGAEPAFLTARFVWFQAEPTCVAGRTCEPSFPGVAGGKTYIYDLQEGAKTESIITSVADVWPHPA